MKTDRIMHQKTKHLFCSKWMMALFIVHCSLFINVSAGAQTPFTQRIQQQGSAGEGKVTIHQDAAIDELVNALLLTPAVGTRPTQTTGNRPTRQEQPTRRDQPARQDQAAQPANQSQLTTEPEQQQAGSEETVDVPVRKERIKGYRIRVYDGGSSRQDRIKAEQARDRVSSLYPGIYTKVHFYNSLNWRCYVGAYRTYREAREVRDEIRAFYPGAEITKGDIEVPVIE